MQVKSVSQLNNVGGSESFQDQLSTMTSNQTYIEVSIKRGETAFDSFKCNFTDFLKWIESGLKKEIAGLDDKLNRLSASLSATIDENFVHKTVTGQYAKWANTPEVINGDKYFNNQLSGANGDFISLSGYNLTATNVIDTNLTVTNLTSTYSKEANLTATNLTAQNTKTTKLTATQYPADLTAKAALWS